MPDVSLLLPLAELLGISVTELLEGRRLEEQQLPANEVEALVKKALTIPKEPVEVRRGRVKKYLPVYLVCNVLGAVEALAVWNLGWVSEKMGTLLWVSCFFGFFFGAYYFFTEEVLPSYYDENRINYIAQGAFRMNIPGVYFNNHNWPIILRWARIWTVVTALGHAAAVCGRNMDRETGRRGARLGDLGDISWKHGSVHHCSGKKV